MPFDLKQAAFQANSVQLLTGLVEATRIRERVLLRLRLDHGLLGLQHVARFRGD
jgi:hypothetical protein